MNGDSGHQSNSYSSLYGSTGDNDRYQVSGDIGYDMNYSLTADMVDLIHPSVSIVFILGERSLSRVDARRLPSYGSFQ